MELNTHQWGGIWLQFLRKETFSVNGKSTCILFNKSLNEENVQIAMLGNMNSKPKPQESSLYRFHNCQNEIA